MALGKLLYYGWYAPKRMLLSGYERSFVAQLGDKIERFKMEASIRKLSAHTTPLLGTKAKLCFLTGRKFWYQTIYCALSLQQVAGKQLAFSFFDDGSLSKFHIQEFARIFPESRLISYEDIEARLDTHLPRDQFPGLRDRRLVYPHISKLVDVHVGESGWKLVLDSDMLFFSNPREILDWLKEPSHPIHLVDKQTHYGYSNALMSELSGASIPERINVGVTGLLSESLDWNELEKWCNVLLDREGSHYLQEQALIAMLLSRKKHIALPEERYIVQPRKGEVTAKKGALHHYVSDSKPWYFRYAWQSVFDQELGL